MAWMGRASPTHPTGGCPPLKISRRRPLWCMKRTSRTTIGPVWITQRLAPRRISLSRIFFGYQYMSFPAANPALARALTERGYTELTPVQTAVLEAQAEARDLLVSAQTGSGKTVAYGLAFAPTLLGGETVLPRAGAPLALIIAPTRELAMQVERELAWLYSYTGARVASCIGGMDGQREARALSAGAHIVVGTPGRLCDHLRRGRLNLTELRVLVLDEADEMLDLGFRDELDQILAATPEWRRTLLFSATIAKEITALARQYQNDALRIDTLVRNQAHADIEYRAVRAVPREIEHAVVNVLRYVESPTALVFCATREHVRHLHASLMERGFTSVALSGELTQNERTRAPAVHAGRARRACCVATDVAARGLDLPDLGSRDPCRYAHQQGHAAAPQRPHRAGRAQGHVRGDRAGQPRPRGRNAVFQCRRQRRLERGAHAGGNPRAGRSAAAGGPHHYRGGGAGGSDAGAVAAGRALGRGYCRGADPAAPFAPAGAGGGDRYRGTTAAPGARRGTDAGRATVRAAGRHGVVQPVGGTARQGGP